MDIEAVLLVATIVSFGMVMIYLAKIAKHQNKELRSEGVAESGRPVTVREAAALFFFGSQPKFIEVVGRSLAIFVIAFVAVVVLSVTVLIVVARMNA